ncbi:uncharacterized protein LOC119308065 [Triticum dicoccoides]|uniref:uncharacterized protein LOC119308065 n=1 Tax=Triticum dicoccoides TaxID=85692 RepID=UPI00188E70AA|nr:uncharacterized protein LOC119308065 [Triticum dicoccoides]
MRPMGHAGRAPHVPPPPAECHIHQTCGLQSETGSCRRTRFFSNESNEAAAGATRWEVRRSTRFGTMLAQQNPASDRGRKRRREGKGGKGRREGREPGSGGAAREPAEKAAHLVLNLPSTSDCSSCCKMFYIYVQQWRVSCARKQRRCETGFFSWNEKDQRITDKFSLNFK